MKINQYFKFSFFIILCISFSLVLSSIQPIEKHTFINLFKVNPSSSTTSTSSLSFSSPIKTSDIGSYIICSLGLPCSTTSQTGYTNDFKFNSLMNVFIQINTNRLRSLISSDESNFSVLKQFMLFEEKDDNSNKFSTTFDNSLNSYYNWLLSHFNPKSKLTSNNLNLSKTTNPSSVFDLLYQTFSNESKQFVIGSNADLVSKFSLHPIFHSSIIESSSSSSSSISSIIYDAGSSFGFRSIDFYKNSIATRSTSHRLIKKNPLNSSPKNYVTESTFWSNLTKTQIISYLNTFFPMDAPFSIINYSNENENENENENDIIYTSKSLSFSFSFNPSINGYSSKQDLFIMNELLLHDSYIKQLSADNNNNNELPTTITIILDSLSILTLSENENHINDAKLKSLLFAYNSILERYLFTLSSSSSSTLLVTMTADTYSSPSHYHLSNQLLSRTARVAHLSDDQTRTTNNYTMDEVFEYQIILWFSIILILSVYGAVYALYSSAGGSDTLIFRSVSAKPKSD